MKIYLELFILFLLLIMFIVWRTWYIISQKRLAKKYEIQNENKQKGGEENASDRSDEREIERERTSNNDFRLEASVNNDGGDNKPGEQSLLQEETNRRVDGNQQLAGKTNSDIRKNRKGIRKLLKRK